MSSRGNELLGRGCEGIAALTVKELVEEFECAALRGGGRLAARYADTARRLAIHLNTLHARAAHVLTITAGAAGCILRCQISLQTSITKNKSKASIRVTRVLANGSLEIYFLKVC